MKASNFDYIRPADVAGVLAALAQDGAKLIAGGQSLGPMLNLRLARPALLVDVSRLTPLQQIEDRGAVWRIGAGVTHSRLEDKRLAGAEMLSVVANTIAYRAVRNRGTMGGSLAHADPAADWPVALSALGATVNIRGASGARAVPVETFIHGAFSTALAENEIIESVDVPKLSGAGRFGYYKFCRKTGEFAEASCAAVFDSGRNVARIFLGAIKATPRPFPDAAVRVAREGKSLDVATAVIPSLGDLDAVERRMAATAITRAVTQALAS
jgi:carbon-monoxide dehydrogenase medium subunit